MLSISSYLDTKTFVIIHELERTMKQNFITVTGLAMKPTSTVFDCTVWDEKGS